MKEHSIQRELKRQRHAHEKRHSLPVETLSSLEWKTCGHVGGWSEFKAQKSAVFSGFRRNGEMAIKEDGAEI